jgi:hypothetical protein
MSKGKIEKKNNKYLITVGCAGFRVLQNKVTGYKFVAEFFFFSTSTAIVMVYDIIVNIQRAGIVKRTT